MKKKTVVTLIYKDREGFRIEEVVMGEDISEGGVRIVIPRNIPRDEELNLKVYMFSDPIPLPAKAKIAWSQKRECPKIEKSDLGAAEEELYWAGIQFIDVDSFTRERIIRWVKREIQERKEQYGE